ncbi:Hint domain-containing protein [Schlesneria paludicola]|uniref:Hint domain-containing protein n=1 Tax=Schlesneria paludicola TaxID=360056 RepID=UPI00029B3DBF|nr:Hint domain-containing protein [Schlesneria paludicola]
MGDRIPTKNPRSEEYDFEWPEPDESSWVRLTMEWRKTDGGIVDAELLRPRNWVASSHLEIGSVFKVFSTELELNGIAEITTISPCPPLSTGDGEVVTGRFVTRRADETVRITFETGDTLEGSKSHPIWSPAIKDWVPMEEWAAGDAVLGREGWITVTSVEARNESLPLYNIEVRGEHVYEVTQAGILVHNAIPCTVDPGIPHDLPPNSLTPKEVAEIKAIAKQYNTTIDVVGSRAKGEGRNIFTNLRVGKFNPNGPPNRSDIDFRFDAAHPRAQALMKALRGVGNGAGTIRLKYSNNPATRGGRLTRPPYIRFTPDGGVRTFS